MIDYSHLLHLLLLCAASAAITYFGEPWFIRLPGLTLFLFFCWTVIEELLFLHREKGDH